MKLLSICVPTYNRNKELAELSHQFLIPALNAYSELIEVLVCDNSDPDVASKNQTVLDSRIKYFKNEVNIGFAGNLLRCANEANATYIWIISDDDPILWAGFEELIEMLPQANADGIDCVMLPLQTTNIFGDTNFSNLHTDWQAPRETRITALLQTGKVPFVLFSSAVIRLDKSILLELKVNFFSNDYLQVILFMEMLNTDSLVRFITTSTIDYQPEYNCRFPISSLASSMFEVCQFLHDKFGVVTDYKNVYRSWLLWLLHHRGGLYKIKDADKERWKLLASLPHNLSLKTLVLAFALILPSSVCRPIYIWYYSFKVMQQQGILSFGELRQRVVTTKKFIAKK